MQPWFLLLAFPFILFGLFFLIGTLLEVLSGWEWLVHHYADKPAGKRLGELLNHSAEIGRLRTSATRAVTFEVYEEGLRIRLPWYLTLTHRPILVPWNEIHAQPAKRILGEGVRLEFGDPEVGRITVARKTADHIFRLSNGRWAAALEQ